MNMDFLWNLDFFDYVLFSPLEIILEPGGSGGAPL